MEIGKYEQIDTHLERELEQNGLEALDELQVKTVSQYTSKNSKRHKPTCHCRNKRGNYKN